ncbi:hypothetical protein [Saccharothrix variisporea]|uniref:Lipoprotein n=1 Tax=Saccharothrix variisporea TaxID=543527 RepID=A0A495XCR9_9PSEU|nr:hypothetical protein [Saccharothrix variisporea]RKT71802.1 hypothetical protein DFJ66_5097 [Saccharothrix variisporea]
MKALKAGVVVAAVGMLLAGCGSEWEGDAHFKVLRIVPDPRGERPTQVGVELTEELKGEFAPGRSTYGAALDQFPPDIKVDDQVVCKIRRWDDNGFDGIDPRVEVSSCRWA